MIMDLKNLLKTQNGKDKGSTMMRKWQHMETLTPAQLALLESDISNVEEIYEALEMHFQVDNIKEIPSSCYTEACMIVDKMVGENELRGELEAENAAEALAETVDELWP